MCTEIIKEIKFWETLGSLKT